MAGKETMTSLEIAEVTILRQGIAELESGRKTTCRPKTA